MPSIGLAYREARLQARQGGPDGSPLPYKGTITRVKQRLEASVATSVDTGELGRARKAVELLAGGQAWTTIAQELGYYSVDACAVAVRTWLRSAPKLHPTELRVLQGMRRQELLRTQFEGIAPGNAASREARELMADIDKAEGLVTTGNTGPTFIDARTQIAAMSDAEIEAALARLLSEAENADS